MRTSIAGKGLGVGRAGIAWVVGLGAVVLPLRAAHGASPSCTAGSFRSCQSITVTTEPVIMADGRIGTGITIGMLNGQGFLSSGSWTPSGMFLRELNAPTGVLAAGGGFVGNGSSCADKAVDAAGCTALTSAGADPAVTPEPAPLVLLAMGLCAFAGFAFRRQRAGSLAHA